VTNALSFAANFFYEYGVQDLIAKAGTLLEALPYIQKFSGETFVVKYGGSFMTRPTRKSAMESRATSFFLKPSRSIP